MSIGRFYNEERRDDILMLQLSYGGIRVNTYPRSECQFEENSAIETLRRPFRVAQQYICLFGKR